MSREFVVKNDGTIELIYDLPDSEVVNMIRSDRFRAAFRLFASGIEYAEVDLIKETVKWKVATQQKEAKKTANLLFTDNGFRPRVRLLGSV